MYRRPNRRRVLGGLCAAVVLPFPVRAAEDALAALDAGRGVRLGVLAVDTGTGRSLAHRADERFLMCSTAKSAVVAAVLARVDAGAEQLERRVPYGRADLAVGYAPDTTAHLDDGGMSVADLCRAAIVHSDNAAANLLVAGLGGPTAVTRYVRGTGDGVSRFDRIEPALNHPDGDRDTTTPRAFAGVMRASLLGPGLSAASRGLLAGWMDACTTGAKRLRAGLPPGWAAGDKTGTAGAQADDVALLRPPGRAAIVVAAYLDAPALGADARETLLREVGAVVARWGA